jgi:hypothetical protein
MGRDQSPRLRRPRTIVRIRRHARSLRLVEHLGQEVQGRGDRLYRPERQCREYPSHTGFRFPSWWQCLFLEDVAWCVVVRIGLWKLTCELV